MSWLTSTLMTRNTAGILTSTMILVSASWMQTGHAAPMDARATSCAINTGGSAPSGAQYAAYAPANAQRAVAPTQSTMAIPNNPSAGQILMSMASWLPNYSGSAQGMAAAYYNCPYGAVENFTSTGTLAAGLHKVYNTNIPGIGYRIAYYVNDSNPGDSEYAPVSFTNEFTNGVLIFPFGGSQFGSAVKATIELIATGAPVTAGIIDSSQIYAQSVLSGGGSAPSQSLYRVFLQGNITVTEPTCIAPPQAGLTMTLPDLSTNDLLRDGEGPMTDTTITVTCTVESQNSPSMTIASPYLVPGSGNVLSNVSPEVDKADGIGVGLWIAPVNPGGNYIPAEFGTAQSGQGRPVGNLPSNTWQYGLGAKIKQLGADNAVKAGPIRATATLTFTYN